MENRSAIKIQSLVRRFLARQATKKLFRAQFDDIRKERFAGGQTFVRKVSLEQMEALLLRLFMCFSVDEDKERLVSFTSGRGAKSKIETNVLFP